MKLQEKVVPKFFEEIKAGLEEALAWAMGEDVPVTIRKVESPGRRTSPHRKSHPADARSRCAEPLRRSRLHRHQRTLYPLQPR